MKLVTYATHSFGTYDQLINSGHPIVVLGWGTKWNGFMDKFKTIRKYLDTLDDDEIVVFLDGFDSVINKSLDSLENDFKSFDCKVLVSHDSLNVLPLHDYMRTKIFGTCKNNKTANTGLYMGYVSHLKIVLDKNISGTSDDDQINFNQLCQHFQFIKVDDEKIIFENCESVEHVSKSKSYFSQMPGTISTSRVTRAIKEYSKYFWIEIFIFILFLLIIGYYIFKVSRN